MKTGKKIAVGLAAALAVAIFAAGAVSMVGAFVSPSPSPEPIEYSVTVGTFNVELVVYETDFGLMLPGEYYGIDGSFEVFNPGDIDAGVEGDFITECEDIFGLTGGSVIPAENFDIDGVLFDNGGYPVLLAGVPAGDTTSYDAGLFVPIDQPGAEYNGTVELIFTPDIPD